MDRSQRNLAKASIHAECVATWGAAIQKDLKEG